MTTALEGRQLALELETVAADGPVDRVRIARMLRGLADTLETTLQTANALAESMDAVHTDRVILVKKVNQLSAELAYEKRGAEAQFY